MANQAIRDLFAKRANEAASLRACAKWSNDEAQIAKHNAIRFPSEPYHARKAERLFKQAQSLRDRAEEVLNG